MPTVTPSWSAPVFFALCAILSTGCVSCGPDDVPAPDICDQPSSGTIDSLELGESDPEGVFVPWQDGHAVSLVYGTQGGVMLPVRLRVSGTDSTCVAQRVTVANQAGEILVDLDYPMRLYPEDDGSMVSDINYAIFGPAPADNELVTVTATLADQMVVRDIVIRW